MTVAEWVSGRDRPEAQLAVHGDWGRTIEAWLSEESLHFARVELAALGLPSEQTLGGDSPVILTLTHEALTEFPGPLLDKLTMLAKRAPVIAILDAKSVDVLPPFLDVGRAEFVAWPCERETFMALLQQIEMPTLRERAESSPINPDLLREEVERIAKALSALVEGSATAALPCKNVRDNRESALLIRGIIRRRRARAQFFPAELFADPAWDMLLDLAAARLEATRVSISSLCIAAAVPTTTALRWIKGMTSAGIFEREADPEDGRRSFIRLTDKAVAAMESYLTLIDEAVV